jgi:hypothetical protein
MPLADFETRRLTVAANSFDPETRTFTADAATETPVRISDFRGDYWQVLKMPPRMGRAR